MPPILKIAEGFDVSGVVAELEASPELWNEHRERTTLYNGPHGGVSDIWVRYNDFANFDGDLAAFNEPHESVWYPGSLKLPTVRSLVYDVMRVVEGDVLGGVLITKVPPGGRVEPHIDGGWHAGFYGKFAIQIKGNQQQAFHFEDAELRAEPGDLYTFDNSKLHWVTNDSDSDRITLIICIRKGS